ncbi:S-adenosyl-L-methionine-dependent methyltransferase [Geopyxis carbonaria]|nr:S-adenosyl-L-methionine-dependent methyltransferase [Geopyxis carbonaria]
MSTAPYEFTNDEYEHDARWTAVDAYSVSHLHPPSRPNTAALANALKHLAAEGLPDDSTYPAFGKFLALQCTLGRVSHVLEVGTLGGYTAIWIASLNPNIRITGLELDPHHAAVTRANVDAAGVGDRVEIIVGPAIEALPKLAKEVEAGVRPKFGFTFIDADKENNWAYFEAAVGISLQGAAIVVDNVVRKGNLASSDPGVLATGPVQGARQVVEEAGKDPRVEACVIQTVSEKNYDGIVYAVVK